MSESKTFYLTTPIYYVNDKPHIGHAYTTVLADVLSRYHRGLGDEVFFLTGLDEHGQKVQQAAEARGVAPQAHCDEMAPRFLELWKKLGIRYDDFIRTTESRHVTLVQDVLRKVHEKGDIYEGEYEGWYSVAEERFITEKELESGEFRDVQKLKEKNYYFRMGQYQQALIDHIQANPQFIQPDHRRNEVLGFLRQPLGDLCISRPKSRLGWGIELPFDKDYVTYVWFDALLNYVTAPGYLRDETTFSKWWPADYHLIGKDILTTHAVYWPTMLFSAGIPQPKTIFAHGWWLSGESKMSKSLGNVVNPMDLIEDYGVDPFRYYLMREMVLGQDASFSLESFVKRYNSDLANDLGNLLSRASRLVEKHFDGKVPSPGESTDDERRIQETAGALGDKIRALIEGMKIHDAIEETMQFVRSVNRYIDKQAPWKTVKTDLSTAGRTLYTTLEALRIGALFLEPVIPDKVATILKTLGAEGSPPHWGGLCEGATIAKQDALFPRIELPKEKAPKEEAAPPKGKKKGGKEKEAVNLISFDDFSKVELKVAEVVQADKIEGADRLLKLQVEIAGQRRQIVAGLADYYKPEQILGQRVVVVTNLEPATIRGVKSEGMLLAAKKGKKMAAVTVDAAIPTGARVS